jgi:hypothetical protein
MSPGYRPIQLAASSACACRGSGIVEHRMQLPGVAMMADGQEVEAFVMRSLCSCVRNVASHSEPAPQWNEEDIPTLVSRMDELFEGPQLTLIQGERK